MDRALLAWERAASARHRGGLPTLWLFTDLARLADPRGAVAALPRGRAGVVLRHDTDPTRATLGHDLAALCRARRLVLLVAGDTRLAMALGAGVHLRGGRWPDKRRPRRGLVTSSAHGVAELRRAWRAGAGLVFLSPAFPTASHPGAPALGPLRWAARARQVPMPVRVAALGGVSGTTVRRLPPRLCHGVGAIGALAQGVMPHPAAAAARGALAAARPDPASIAATKSPRPRR